MTWLAPWALGAAAVAAIGIGLLHLLARDRPARWTLPTARFVATGAARATRRAQTPRDLALLALRVLALLLAGAAFAGPVLAPDGGSVARVVLLDRSSADAAAAVAAARAQLGPGDRLVLFDTTARAIAAGMEAGVLDSLAAAAADTLAPTPPDASLSAGLVAAMRTAADAASEVDSVGLVVVSPFVGVADDATTAIRDVWPGRIDVVAVATPPAPRDSAWRMRVRGAGDDPVVIAARLAGATPVSSPPGDGARGALIVRGAPAPADSAFARAGGTLVVWRDSAFAASGDTVSGFVAGDGAVLFATVRRGAPSGGRVVARWIDGAPAATELALGRGCVRDVAIAVPSIGDLTLRPAFQRGLRALAGPCAAALRAPASDSVRAALGRAGPLASASQVRRDRTRSPATPLLLAAALLLLLLEPLLRRGARGVQPVGEPA